MIRIERSLRQNVRLIETSRMSYSTLVLDRFISMSIYFLVFNIFKKYDDEKQSKYHAIFTWLTNCDWIIITKYHVIELPNRFMNSEPNLNYIRTGLELNRTEPNLNRTGLEHRNTNQTYSAWQTEYILLSIKTLV